MEAWGLSLESIQQEHLTSLVYSVDGIRRFIPKWNLNEVAREATGKWLRQQLCMPVDINLLIVSMIAGKGFGDKSNLSLAQWCEAAARARTIKTFTSEEKLHIASNAGPANGWVRATPLAFKQWQMKPRLWLVAVRSRLYQKVSPRRSICVACRKMRADVKGEHQVGCASTGGLMMRHDAIGDLLRQELPNLG